DRVLLEGHERDAEPVSDLPPVRGDVLLRGEHPREHGAGDEKLSEELVARGEPLRALHADLEVVVEVANDAVAGRHRRGSEHEDVSKIAPEDRRAEDREEQERAAHRGRAPLHLVGGGAEAVVADDPADLPYLKLADEPRREQKADEHRRDGRGDDAKRHVTEDVEPPEPARVVAQRVKELVDHGRTDDAEFDAGGKASGLSPRVRTSSPTTRSA